MLRATPGLHFNRQHSVEQWNAYNDIRWGRIGDKIYTRGIYEPATVGLISKLLDKETGFFDIGAHIGQYTLVAAPLAREVHCFQAMPWIYKILQSNIRRNKLTNVIPNSSGVMDYTGSADVWQGPKDNSGSGSFLRIPGVHGHSYSVDCVTSTGTAKLETCRSHQENYSSR
jgi:FkbM family methyltransferase